MRAATCSWPTGRPPRSKSSVASCRPLAAPATRSTRRLAYELDIPIAQITAKVGSCDTFAPIAIDSDIPSAPLIYLAEHRAQLPGVVEQQTTVRYYPYGAMAAQILGYVNQLNADNLADPNFKGVPAGDLVGQAGLEYTYDHYLRGRDGTEHIQVDAAGQPTGKTRSSPPVPGDELQTTLHLGLEREGMAALAEGMKLAHSAGYPGVAASFVALDPDNGAVLGIGSLPAYDPNVLSQPYISYAQYAQQSAGDSFVDRAISGTYPTGSTFKPITALAALQAGLITPGTLLGATPSDGCWTYARQRFCNSDNADFGANDLATALEVSEDTYFYQLGAEANARGAVIQSVARELGLGHPTGIDLPDEFGGIVPDATWVAEQDAAYRRQECAHGRHGAFCPTGLYVWTTGQNIQLATGQGLLEATPLQMAVAYSALANGGTIVTPHVGMTIDGPGGRRLLALPAPPAGRLPASDDADLSPILAGLHLAAQGARGTSDDVFANFPLPVYGKTGTAQLDPSNQFDDQSWYVAYVPDGSRSIVVAVTIEKGGYGDDAAAPAARLILAKWFGLPETVVQGTSTSR